MKKIISFLLSSVMLSQTSDLDRIAKAHQDWNFAANAANVWANQHKMMYTSAEDLSLFHSYIVAEHKMEKEFREIGYK